MRNCICSLRIFHELFCFARSTYVAPNVRRSTYRCVGSGWVCASFGVRRKLVFKSDISKSSACFSDMMSRNPGFFEQSTCSLAYSRLRSHHKMVSLRLLAIKILATVCCFWTICWIGHQKIFTSKGMLYREHKNFDISSVSNTLHLFGLDFHPLQSLSDTTRFKLCKIRGLICNEPQS